MIQFQQLKIYYASIQPSMNLAHSKYSLDSDFWLLTKGSVNQENSLMKYSQVIQCLNGPAINL